MNSRSLALSDFNRFITNTLDRKEVEESPVFIRGEFPAGTDSRTFRGELGPCFLEPGLMGSLRTACKAIFLAEASAENPLKRVLARAERSGNTSPWIIRTVLFSEADEQRATQMRSTIDVAVQAHLKDQLRASPVDQWEYISLVKRAGAAFINVVGRETRTRPVAPAIEEYVRETRAIYSTFGVNAAATTWRVDRDGVFEFEVYLQVAAPDA